MPGQFLAVDPKGRAVMIGAIEKQKFVYILNRTLNHRLLLLLLDARCSHNTVIATTHLIICSQPCVCLTHRRFCREVNDFITAGSAQVTHTRVRYVRSRCGL